MNENIEKIEMADRVSMPVYHLDDRNEDNLSLYDKVSYVEKAYDTDILDLKSACDKLNSYEKSLINNRYYLDKTQQEVAETLGISQVKVISDIRKKYYFECIKYCYENSLYKTYLRLLEKNK